MVSNSQRSDCCFSLPSARIGISQHALLRIQFIKGSLCESLICSASFDLFSGIFKRLCLRTTGYWIPGLCVSLLWFSRGGWEISAFCLQQPLTPNFWNNIHSGSDCLLKTWTSWSPFTPVSKSPKTGVPRLLRWKHLCSYSLAIFQVPWCFPFPIPQGFLGMNDLSVLGNQIFKGTFFF